MQDGGGGGGLLFNEDRGLNFDKEFQPQVTSLGLL